MQKKKKIFIVEKDPTIDIKQKLELKGFDVFDSIRSGKQAISLIQQEEPDLLLIDINLEGKINGIDVAKSIKQFCDIPILFLLEKSDELIFNTAMRLEPSGYIVRPIIENELYPAIELALYKHEMEKNSGGKMKNFPGSMPG